MFLNVYCVLTWIDYEAIGGGHHSTHSHHISEWSVGYVRTVASVLLNPLHNCVHHIIITDFYDEVLALLDLFTSVAISSQMWPMLGILYEMFTRDGFDYFSGDHRLVIISTLQSVVNCSTV